MTNGRLKARGRGPRQGGQAIRRAVTVLRTLAIGGERGVPLAEVVQATSLARPTVHRIVHVLIEEGIKKFVEPQMALLGLIAQKRVSASRL